MNAKTKSINAETLNRFCDALNISVSEIYNNLESRDVTLKSNQVLILGIDNKQQLYELNDDDFEIIYKFLLTHAHKK